MGVFSSQDRKLTATGTIRFTPDLRAAVEVDFEIYGAYKENSEGVIVPFADTQKLTNYTLNTGYNPTISDFDTITYEGLQFNPGALNTEETTITLKFTFTNHSIIDNPMRVTFAETSNNPEIGTSGKKINYTIAPTDAEFTIAKGEFKDNVIITLKSDLTAVNATFSFNFTFDFESIT